LSSLFTKIITIDQTISTNEYAFELLKTKKAKEGVVIFAKFQTKGKGQRGGIWKSEYGKNMLMSIIFYPNIPIKSQFELNICIALALYDFFTKYFKKDLSIKWPNDILIYERKISGILIQNIVKRNRIKNMIVGIGLNVNQKRFPDFLTKATSLALELEQEFELPLLQKELLDRIENRYIEFKQGEIKKMKDEYLANLFGFNQWKDFKIQGKHVKAKIVGLNNDGRLLTQLEKGKPKVFSLKEISYLF